MSTLSVAAVAAEWGVSERRVRQMLADGTMPGERVGRDWVIDSVHVHSLKDRRPEVGRPWSKASAWALLDVAMGAGEQLTPLERSRARKRLTGGLGKVVARLGVRASRRWFYTHPGVIDRLGSTPGVVRGGISAGFDHGADLVAREEFEGYVQAGQLAELIERFGLDDQAPHPNTLLRVVDDEVWPFRPDQSIAGRSVVAVDLLESGDPRTQRAGAEMLEHK